MRQVTRPYNSKPRKLTLATTISEWNKIAVTGDTNLITKNIYRDPYNTFDGTGSRVIDKLNRWYLYKCAYCERIYKLDVEHYRPKAEVRDENNNIIQVTNGTGLMVNHPGYYWLCYEWSNLIPSCITCNREGGKSSKFPTIHHYEFQPLFNPPPTLDYNSCLVNANPLLSELPCLLNPETDNNFLDFFNFIIDPNKKGIRIEGIDVNNRGKITADICKLNRDEVKYDRVQNVIYPIKKTMLSYIILLSNGRRTTIQFKNSVDDLIQKLYDDSYDEKLNHTLLRKFIVASSLNFENIVIPFISKSAKKILLEAFTNYIPE